MNITINFSLFELVWVQNSNLNRQFWFLWPNLPKKGNPNLKQKKWLYIQHIQIRLGSNLHLKQKILTAWKVSIFVVFLVRIFPYSGWIRREFVFSPNTGRYGPEKLRIRTLLMQCLIFQTNFSRKGTSGLKHKKRLLPLYSAYSN